MGDDTQGTGGKGTAGRGSAPQGREARRASLSRRVFGLLVAVSAAVAVIVALAASMVYQSALVKDARDTLEREGELVASALDASDDHVAALSALDLGDLRATLVAADGTVAFDSASDPATMGNHADRPEIQEARRDGVGWAERESDTVGRLTVYRAQLLDSGEVLRLGTDRDALSVVLLRDLGIVCLVVLAMTALFALISRSIARALVRPILGIELDGRSVAPYVELDPLVDRFNEQHAELEQRMEELRGVDDMRREFTANVTHELKTPIASISGASELIAAGVVREGDVRGFAQRIYDDAQRLSALVSDILMLSRLDESERDGDKGSFGAMEPCDLRRIALDVSERLASQAEEAQVSVLVVGAREVVVGNPRLLDELLHNLMENAVRYNRPGGHVVVTVGERLSVPFVRVADTGIGIPAEAQPKVFERFYRVDKGRSRETGGTGLGLAIVKHAAAFHGATIDLQSTLGEGTTITVCFPARVKSVATDDGLASPHD